MVTEVRHMTYPVCEAVAMALVETEGTHAACQAAELCMAHMETEATSLAYTRNAVVMAHIGTEMAHMAYSACEAV